MQVILRTTDEVSSKETKEVSTIQTENAVKTTERVPSPKAAFRKFSAECNLQAQCAAQDTLANQFNAGTLQQQIASKKIDPNTLIHRAIIEHNTEVLAFLLGHHVDVDYPDANGMSPLTIAILSQQAQIVKLLLQNGADVTPQKKWNGMSLLEISMTARDLESTRSLIQFGADINAVFKNGQSPLVFAFKDFYNSKDSRLINLILDTNKLPAPGLNDLLMFLTQINTPGSNELLSKTIQKGADVNSENGRVLLAACGLRYFDKVMILLANGANPNLFPTGSYLSPLTLLADNISMIKLLLDAKANPDWVLIQGNIETHSPLVEAILKGTPESALERVKLLVEAGADINRKINKKTPLEYALEIGRMDVVNYLLLKDSNA